ncbi:MAG: T9SS type A sorting domain-containing protein [Candidatus Fermentibacteraceae bacterium]
MGLLLPLLFLLGSRPMPVSGTFFYPGVIEITGRHDPRYSPTGGLALLEGGHQVGDVVYFWAQSFVDEYTTFYLTSATCRAVGEKTYIFVEDTQWESKNFDQSGVDSLYAALEGSTGIIASLEYNFGPIPDELDDDPRTYILVLDIPDGWDPVTNPGYIAGYFSPYNQFTEFEARLFYGGHSNEVEMLYVDCNPGRVSDASFVASHELVHLIHWGIKPFSSQDLWVLENQAQTGPYVCGYNAFQVETFLETGGVTPINWTSYDFTDIRYIAGYGAGFLFFSYLMENYGGRDFIWNSIRSDARGVRNIEESIALATGQTPVFDNIMRDWMLSCFIDDVDRGYGWEGFTIASIDTVSPGNRPGIDWTGIIDETPWQGPELGVGAYQGLYYHIAEGLSGSLRIGASGIGNLEAYLLTDTDLTPVNVSGTGDVAVPLDSPGTLLLLNNAFAGLSVTASAGSVGGGLAVYPNPCLGDLYFQFISQGAPVSLAVFDQTGAVVDTRDFGYQASGERVIVYTGAGELASGIYFYRLVRGENVESGRFAVVR